MLGVSQPPAPAAALALGGTWLAFMVGVFLGGDIEDVATFGVAAACGAALVALGFAAAWRRRALSQRSAAERVFLIVLAIGVGAALGLANLAANWMIASSDPAIRAALTERFAALPALNAVLASPLVEEISIRLFLMSVIAWGIFRFTGREGLAFVVALLASAVFFSILHLGRPLPIDPGLANFYRIALFAKYTAAGVALGWVFWRWGLPYAILCHIAANAVHFALQSRVF